MYARYLQRMTRLPRRALVVLAAGAALAAVSGAFAVSASAEEVATPFPGSPLTVDIGPLGQCQSSYPAFGGNFYFPESPLGDCGFFLAFPRPRPHRRGGIEKRPGALRRRGPHMPGDGENGKNTYRLAIAGFRRRHRSQPVHADDGLQGRSRWYGVRTDHRDDDLREWRAAVHVDLRREEHDRSEDLLPRDVRRRPLCDRQRLRHRGVPRGPAALHWRAHGHRRCRRLLEAPGLPWSAWQEEC